MFKEQSLEHRVEVGSDGEARRRQTLNGGRKNFFLTSPYRLAFNFIGSGESLEVFRQNGDELPGALQGQSGKGRWSGDRRL